MLYTHAMFEHLTDLHLLVVDPVVLEVAVVDDDEPGAGEQRHHRPLARAEATLC